MIKGLREERQKGAKNGECRRVDISHSRESIIKFIDTVNSFWEIQVKNLNRTARRNYKRRAPGLLIAAF
jgi:hypothetical protein